MSSFKFDKRVWVYIFLAFVFSLSVRYIWVYQFHSMDGFKWNGEFMINTNDGYYWAEGARDILRGFHQTNDLSPVDSSPSKLTAFFVKILPFSFESIIFYMSAFLSSLIVIPVVLLAQRVFQKAEVGFVSALFSSVAWSYYNRTMVGYYDTDMLIIVFPAFLLYFLISSLKLKEDRYLLFSAITMIAYKWWYSQSYSLDFAFFGLIFLYTIVYARKEVFNYKLLALMLLSMVNIPLLYSFLAVLLLYTLFKKENFDRYIYYILAFVLILFLFTGGFNPIWSQLKGYVFKDSIKVLNDNLHLHFFSVMQTVREAGKIPFEVFANRISGNTISFVLSLVGYILMSIRYPLMLISLPMVGLGFIAYVGGLRFTIYAIIPLAFGISYLIFYIIDYLESKKVSKYLRYTLLSLFVIAILYPNIRHIQNYKVPTVFSKAEVAVLDRLKSISNRDDYVVAWWDYGYPIRYYSDVKTLIDGGKHSGDVNFPVSFILTNPLPVASKMARLDVEYNERAFLKKGDKDSLVASMMSDYGFKNSNTFLKSLDKIELPKKSRDVYIYLPYRMLGIFPTVARFSDIDLMSGKVVRRAFFYQSRTFRNTKDKIILGNGIFLDKKRGVIYIGKQEIPLRLFIRTEYTKKGEFKKSITKIHDQGINLIYMKSYNTILLLDNMMLNSLYIQLFVLENFDKKLIEPVILNPNSKVFKLKI